MYFIRTSFSGACKQDLLSKVRNIVRYLHGDATRAANISHANKRGVVELTPASERSVTGQL